METSDSECFESADESFHSDDNSVIVNRIQNLEVQDDKNEDKKEYVKRSEVENKSQEASVEQAKKVVDNAKNAEVQKIKPTKTKLGTKLATKITKVEKEQALPEKCEPKIIVKEDKSDETFEENLWENDGDWGDIEDNLDNMYTETVEAELEILKKEAKPISPPVVSQADLAESLTETGEVKKGRLCSKYIPDEDRWAFDSGNP